MSEDTNLPNMRRGDTIRPKLHDKFDDAEIKTQKVIDDPLTSKEIKESLKSILDLLELLEQHIELVT